ncbi:hypothetical protein NDI37_09835 [Funiculus sociatus GB2-A5]|uniref:Uncharacterized protein n=1 Tax=Funiculus sociatus GB2-A5 TaxID=2933946 RepID=A0ABV0JMR0_9CYAN|nr:hypothetical protein [Trichocoleus sp. FACHB-832]MBD1907802.1 hypothetical protein [Trichocoleus sp. FACHB-832]MBD2063980.1 hypothetical protein [Trichocoleus sp. FACHB-6]
MGNLLSLGCSAIAFQKAALTRSTVSSSPLANASLTLTRSQPFIIPPLGSVPPLPLAVEAAQNFSLLQYKSQVLTYWSSNTSRHSD